MDQEGRINRGRPRQPGTVRRNFGDESVEEEERLKQEQIKKDKNFNDQYGRYFLHRDVRKKRLQFESNPELFFKELQLDPEIMIRDKLEAEDEIQRHDLVIRGRMYAQKWLDEYDTQNFETDENGIQHFKPKNIESIEKFNESFEENNRIYEAVREKLEGMLCSPVTDRVIAANKRKKDEILRNRVHNDGLREVVETYDAKITKLEKRKSKLGPDQQPTINNGEGSSRSAEINQKLERIKLKREIVNDQIALVDKKPGKFSQEWFRRNKNNLDEYNKKYGVEKYRNAKFKYDRNYQHFFVFIPSGGGKTTLATKFSRYIADIDDVIEYENNVDKVWYLTNYSEFFNDWKVNNNYWQEMFLTYEYKFRNRIVVCHSPDMLPEGTITEKNQSFIILPSVKKWTLRYFKTNYDSLYSMKHSYTTVSLHYRYYFYVIYNFFFMYDQEYQFGVVEQG